MPGSKIPNADKRPLAEIAFEKLAQTLLTEWRWCAGIRDARLELVQRVQGLVDAGGQRWRPFAKPSTAAR